MSNLEVRFFFNLHILILPSFHFSSPDIDVGLSWDMT